MKYFFISSYLDGETFDKLMDFANANQSEEWTIFLNSKGGESYMMWKMLKLINDHKDQTVLIASQLWSAAFVLFFKAKCRKMLLPAANGMYHEPYRSVEMRSSQPHKPVYESDVFMNANFKKHFINRDADIWPLLTTKEYALYKRGDDVWLDFTRLQQIFPEATVYQ
jgi:hypothetical protein